MINKSIKIGIIEADQLYSDLQDDYQSYGVMFARLFEQLPNWSNQHYCYQHYYILDGHWPSDHNPCDVYLITGSKSGVYDTAPWIPKLINWIQRQYQLNVPLLGICFGHQILAHALGGNASQCDRGWGVGIRSISLNRLPSDTSVSETDITAVSLIYSHQDQVDRLPADAQILLADEFCPYAAFEIPQRVLAFQGHPEFTSEYLQRLLPRRIKHIGAATLNAGLSSLDKAADDLLVAQWMINFIDANSGRQSE